MQLTKHHGLGNDFLIFLDTNADRPIAPAEARALCDRRTGVGADGIIRAVPGSGGPGGAPADMPESPDRVVAAMQLMNADGSHAEMSGNGIRCLAQALLLAGWVPAGADIPIATDAGTRTVRIAVPTDTVGDSGARVHTFAVEMGRVTGVTDAGEWADAGVGRVLRLDVGNPHLVFEITDALTEPDLVELGERANAALPGGMNVHLLRPDGLDGIAIRSYERGIGLTLACGTGACASAVAANRWGLVGESVRVDMPGGRASVVIGDPMVLIGPAVFVATVDTAMSSAAARSLEEAPCP